MSRALRLGLLLTCGIALVATFVRWRGDAAGAAEPKPLANLATEGAPGIAAASSPADDGPRRADAATTSAPRIALVHGLALSAQGAPVPGAIVRCEPRITGVPDASSDERGAFAISIPVPAVASLAVEAPAGWKAIASELALTDRHVLGGEPAVFLFEPVALGPSLVLVDARTREPVPNYLVEVPMRGDGIQNVETDAEGKLDLGEVDGSRPFRLVDWPGGKVLERELDDAESGRLAVEVGPTFRLTLTGPGADEPRLCRGWIQHSVSRTGFTVDGARFAPVRVDSAGAWIRLPAVPSPMVRQHERDPLVLVLANDAASTLGVAPIAAVRGIQELPLSVSLEPFSRARGRVRTPKGAPIPSASIALYPIPYSGGEAYSSGRSGADGSFELVGARGMEFTLVASAEGHAASTREASASELDELEIVLERELGEHEVTVEVLYAEGVTDCLVSLFPSGPGGAPKSVPCVATDEDAKVRAVFRQISRGRYEVVPSARDVDFVPERVMVDVPGNPAPLIFHANRRLRCSAVLRVAHEPAPDGTEVFASSEDGSGPSHLATVRSGKLAWSKKARRWYVLAPGFVPTSLEAPMGDGSVSKVEVTPRVGWGAVVVAMRDGRALPGVSARSAGRELGVSGDDGAIVLTGEDHEELLEVELWLAERLVSTQRFERAAMPVLRRAELAR